MIWLKLSLLKVGLASLLIVGGVGTAWALVANRPIRESGIALTPVGEFHLGFGYDPSDPTSWVAAASKEANLLAAYDHTTHQVHTYDLQGLPQSSFGGTGMVAGLFMRPSGLHINGEGQILVADQRVPVIRRYDTKGTLLKEWPVLEKVSGWVDVAEDETGTVFASPNPESALLKEQGVNRFDQSGPRELCTECFGPIISTPSTVFLLNGYDRQSKSVWPYLTGLSPEGAVRFRSKHDDHMIKPDMQYWKQAGVLVVANAGNRQIEAYSLEGKPYSYLMQVPESEKPPIAALPVGDRLLVVHHDGLVRIYQATIPEPAS